MPQEYEKVVSIACINFDRVWGDKAANLKKIKSFTEQAADQGNNIIVFPELALSGYECSDEFNHGCSMHRELAETIPGPSTEEIAEIAKKRGIYVIFGMPEKEKDHPDILHISAPIVGPEGILGAYRKIHLRTPPLTESTCFKPGDNLPVFETRFGPIGIQICLDFWAFPEGSRILTLKGAEIIINPAASPSGPGKEEFMVHQTRARGVENMVYAASANLTGQDRTLWFYGHSTIAGRGWKVTEIYAEGGPEEGIVSATLNLELLRRLRRASLDSPTNLEEYRLDVLLKELRELESMKKRKANDH